MKINSVDKAVTVLNCFSQNEPVLKVGVISKMTGYTPSTVSRLLSTLEARGVVERADGYGCYQLGYRIYFWGLISQKQNNLANLALPITEALRDKCGEEVSLYIVVENHRTCLQRVPSKHGIAMTGSIGEHLPLHTGASGQVLLAYLDEKRRRRIIENEKLEGFTKKTLTDPIKLLAKLRKIREQGYAVSLEEREPGAYSIVAPVRDVSGRVIASLSIAGPVYRLDDKVLKANIADVKKSAALISEKIGFTPVQEK
ncbi:MAG: IclR family transcriptional regulator [Deltaproteobacteria bacterium]|nr:IclR family transcriptional regulator [Deltaproteobacteria bacterium]